MTTMMRLSEEVLVDQQTAKTIAKIQHYLTRLYHEINWITALFIVITPFVAIYGLATTAFVPQTWALSFVGYVLGILGIGSGYHRLYAHRTYKMVSRPVELFLLFCATSCFSMSAIDWVKDHRAHHKYTDTERDPYNIKRGFWWAHVGWLLYARKMPKSDVSDLKRDPLLVWQHKNFRYLAVISGWILPLLACGLLWDDWRGGFYIACVFKTVVLHHGIFSINSWAHWWGETPYNDGITPRDSLPCAIWTLGEGYHNFHHEFPNDYRNGVHMSAFDPSKWFIATMEFLGCAQHLKRTPAEQIKLCKLQMIQRKVEQEKKRIFLGVPLELLPFYTKEQVAKLNEKGESLLIMGDLVFDVKAFAETHPGGKAYITTYVGKDISDAFCGGVYRHSNAAHNLLQTLRCGRLLKE